MGDGTTGGTLKFTNPPKHHIPGAAVIVPGVLGLPIMVMVLDALLPGEQILLFAVTDKGPEVNVDPTFNRMVVLPCPLLMVVPAGLVQVKLVAPATLAIEY